ncbi:YhgE/Pip domain-containing protein [Companilactobacillus kimchii]|uniref:Autotransport protein n=2 Tax=Companilactobacillus kimchii TaxID=2801452 RepID=A0ABR5NUQ2_9LACO|nr:YhgE/Pip domain-containing protein [Companilactobacillus kimchii]KRK52452.1 autotransport protein [Companilactobacillus kimchii DSM 13961 = JCM 10707]OWF32569.1 Phage infection protein [Companilactobacillus kimchii]
MEGISIKAWELFKLDLKRTLKSKPATLLMLALVILPCLYCWFNVWALWDPYSNTSGLKVAVYSADTPVEVQGQKIEIGDQLIDNLKKNHKLGWTFVNSKKELDQGVKDGSYYAGIYIPKTFSKDIISFLSGTIKKPKLVFKVNQKINAIAPKLTETGATTLQNTISSEFVGTISKTITQALNKSGMDIKDNLPMLRRFESLLVTTDDNIPELQNIMDKVQKANTLVPNLNQKLNQVNDMYGYLPLLNEDANKLVNVNNILPLADVGGTAAKQLKNKIPEIQNAGTQINEVDTDFGKISSLMSSSITQVQNGLEVIQKVQNVMPEVQKLGEDAKNATDKTTSELIPKIQQALPVIKTTIDTGLSMVYNLGKQISSSAEMINTLIDKIKEDPTNQQLKAQLKTVIQNIATDSTHLAKVSRQVASALTDLQNFFNRLAEQLGKDKLTLLDKPIQHLNDLATLNDTLATKANDILNNYDSLDTSELQSKLTDLQTHANQVADGVNTIKNINIMDSVSTIITDINSFLKELSSTLGTFNTDIIPTIPGLLNNTEGILNTALSYLQKYQKQLPAVGNEIHDANRLLNGNMTNIVTGIGMLNDFYDNDYPTLKNKLAKATFFVQYELPSIENELTTTLNLVNSKTPELEQALSTANDFAENDWPQLKKDIHHSATLLKKGKKDVDLGAIIRLMKSDANKESDFFSNPVKLKQDNLYDVPNYGSASAPFYLALCIWVGALLLSSVFTVHFKLDEKQQYLYTFKQRFNGRYLTFGFLNQLQAISAALGNLFILHAYTKEKIWLIVFCMLVSFVFISILYSLVQMFGTVGKGLGIIILVLSISGAGGNFPVVLSDGFFRVINPYLPFTYAVNLIREAVGGIYWPNATKDIIILLAFGIGFYLLGLLCTEPLKPFMHKLHKSAKKSMIIE